MSLFDNQIKPMSINAYDQQRAMYEMEYQKQIMNAAMQQAQPSVFVPPTPPTLEQLRKDMERTQQTADQARDRYEIALRTTAVKGPTPEQMDKFPAVKEAWEHLKTVMKLTGV